MNVWRAVACAIALGGGLSARAQSQPMNPATPLTVGPAPAPSGNVAVALSAAQRAQELGLPGVAVGLYRQVLAAPNVERAPVLLQLASALLAAGKAGEAEETLLAMPEPRGAEWRLRVGLAAALQRNFDGAREQANAIKAEDLPRSDRGWHWFLQGVLADQAPRERRRPHDFYERAEREFVSDAARMTFLAARLRARLTLFSYTPADIEQSRRAYEQNIERGSRAYPFAEDYAIMCDATGNKAEAVRFLSEFLVRLPRAERGWTDNFRFLLGLIGDRGRGGAGRNALNQLLETGSSPDVQRRALQLLAQDSIRDPERSVFRAELDKLIAATPASPILDSALLARAHVALTDQPRDYATAERRANELKDRFPGSRLRPDAFLVLTTSAWEQRRYRLAAEMARRTREALASAPVEGARAEPQALAQAMGELHVLEAEARFRAEDYRLAAEAYVAALQSVPAGVPVGELVFQRALAEIRADPASAVKVIDELEGDPRFDPAHRWEAEWSLARVLRLRGRTADALQRVSRLLGQPDPRAAIAPELRARMAWLQARLALDVDRAAEALEALRPLATLAPTIEGRLRANIESNAALLQAEAQLRRGQEDAALATVADLQARFPQSEAASQSFLVAAAYFAEPGRDKVQVARTWLRRLTDDPAYKDSPYVPYALFQLALLSERLGGAQDLQEANRTIEEIVDPDRTPPAPPSLVFAARLKQGDLFRTLNQFPPAQRAYEALVNDPKYAQHPDVFIAQLRLAECHHAQASNDPSGSHADQAQSLFEELLYRAGVPRDVSIEAGYNLGRLLDRRGQPDKAREVWWRDVIKRFHVDAEAGAARRATEPYWLARTFLDLGQLLEQQGSLDEARRVYGLLRDSRLGYGDRAAAERLERLGAAPLTSAP